MVSHSIIHATLARLSQPKIALAGFSSTHFLFSALAAPTVTTPLIALSFIKDRRSVRQLIQFTGLIMLGPFLVMLLIGWTSLGDWVFGVVLGLSPAVTHAARGAAAVFCLILPAILMRAVGFGLIMLHRRTIVITYGTAVRLGSLAFYLWVFPRWFDGSALGAVSLLACIATETVYTIFAARPFYLSLPDEAGPPAKFSEMWRFSWPLMLSQISESGVLLLINVFLGRLSNPDLALASFGVVRGLMGLLLSPLRNLVQTIQTLTKSEADLPAVWGFALRVGLGFTAAVLLLFFTPLRGVVLDGVIGLTPELSAYSAPGVMMLAAVPMLWTYAAIMRGLLSAARRTRAIANSSGFRLISVTAIASLTLMAPGLNGALIGIAALAAAYLAETIYLAWTLHRLQPLRSLFPEQAEESV